MGRQRVPAGARLADPDRWVAGRHLRRAARVRARCGRLRAVLPRVRARPDDRDVDRRARLARSGRCAARPQLAGDHRRRLSGGGACRRDRRLDRLGRDCVARRAARGRPDRRPALVALDLRAQPSVGGRHPAARPGCGGAGAARGDTPRRLPRRGPVRGRPRRRRVRADRAASLRLVQPGHPRPARRRHRHVCRLPRPRAPRHGAHAEA